MTARIFYLAAAPFEAARKLESCPGFHGHSFVARVRAALPESWSEYAGGEPAALAARLKTCVEPLDYSFLNDVLDPPGDADLARWLRERLDLPDVDGVGIRSAPDRGVDLDRHGRAHRWQRFRFEAAHRLPNVPADHPCGRLHGHGFEVVLHTAHAQDLAEPWAPLHAELHYACLNDVPGLDNPTSELLARWIWERLKPALPGLSWVTVFETTTAGCHYDGAHYRIWKERRFESALCLKTAPAGDPRRRLHGHSYVARLHLTAPLDAVLGWTVDYGEVKTLFRPLYRQLDHRRLEQGDLSDLLYWIRAQMVERLPPLDRIDLFETPNSGAALCWGEHEPALPV